MNTKIITQHLKFDWLRMKKPLLVYWLLILVSALPWIFRDINSSSIPSSWTGYVESADARDLFGYTFNDNLCEFLRWTKILLNYFTLGLAASIGMNHKFTTPMSFIQKLSGKISSLFLLIVLPKIIFLAVVFIHQKFDGEVIMKILAAQLVMEFVIVTTAALFASYCKNWWQLLAAYAVICSCFFIAVPFLNVIFDPNDFMRTLILNHSFRASFLFAVNGFGGIQVFYFCSLAIILLSLFRLKFIVRLDGLSSVATAICLMIFAALIMLGIPLREAELPSTKNADKIDCSNVKASNLEAFIVPRNSLDYNDSFTSRLDIKLQPISSWLDTENCPKDCVVQWKVTDTAIYHENQKIASLAKKNVRNMPYAEPQAIQNDFVVDDTKLNYQDAINAVLPQGCENHPKYWWKNNRTNGMPVSLGNFLNQSIVNNLLNRDNVVKATFEGKVIRYEKILDVPFDEEQHHIKQEDVFWSVKRLKPTSKFTAAEIIIKHPSLIFSTNLNNVYWTNSPMQNAVVYLHFPKSHLNIKMYDNLAYTNGELYQGAGWHRYIRGFDNSQVAEWGVKPDYTDARLIIITPKVVKTLISDELTAPIQKEEKYLNEAAQHNKNLRRTLNHDVTKNFYYRKLLPQRPNPDTCTEEEFSKWMRNVLALNNAKIIIRDLSAYTERFPEFISRVRDINYVDELIGESILEKDKSIALDALSKMERPERLAKILVKRGWETDVKTIILKRFQNGEVNDITLMCYLAIPETIPELIPIFIDDPSVDEYEKLHALPNTEPRLRDEILRAANQVNLDQVKAENKKNNMGHVKKYYLLCVAAKLGDESALQKMLDVYREGENAWTSLSEVECVFENPKFAWKKSMDMNQEWFDYLKNKNATDFQYDSFSRIWILKPQQ